MLRMLGLAAATFAAASAWAFEDVDGSFARTAPEMRSLLEQRLDYTLLDAPSARIRGVKREGDKSICGWINAKNKFGGYVGYRHFVALRDGSYIFLNKGEISPVEITISPALSACITEKGDPK